MKEMILETKRLLLRELKQDDFNNICKLLQDPIVMYAYEGAFSKKEVQEWLDKQLRRYQNDGFGLWGMIEKDSGDNRKQRVAISAALIVFCCPRCRFMSSREFEKGKTQPLLAQHFWKFGNASATEK